MKPLVIDVNEMTEKFDEEYNFIFKILNDAIRVELNGNKKNIPKLSKKGVYKVYYVICDSAPDGVISLENEEVDTIQIGSMVRKRSKMIEAKEESMKDDPDFRKSVEERVKICLGEL